MQGRIKQNSWLVITLLALVPLLMVLGNSVLIPGFPAMQSKMHVSKFQVSLLITLFSVPAGVVIPLCGFLSDRISRKWIVVPSLLLFGIGGVVAGFAAWWLPRPYTVVLVGRVIQGIGAAGTAPIAMAWVGDLFTGSERSKVLGINEAGNAFGKVVSPIVGAVVVAVISWFSVFFIFPVLCVPLALGVWFLVPDKRSQEKQSVKAYFKTLFDVFRREGRWLSIAYLAGAAALFNLFGVLFYLSDLLEKQYKIDGVMKGFILAIPLVFLSSTSFITGSLIKKHTMVMKWLLVTGFVVLGGSLVSGVWATSNAWVLVGLMSLGAVGTGLIMPCLNMLITSAVSKEKRGIVTSLYGSVRFLGVAFGPPVYTWLLEISTQIMFIAVGCLAGVCALLVLWLIRPQPQPDKGPSRLERLPKLAGRHKARF